MCWFKVALGAPCIGYNIGLQVYIVERFAVEYTDPTTAINYISK